VWLRNSAIAIRRPQARHRVPRVTHAGSNLAGRRSPSCECHLLGPAGPRSRRTRLRAPALDSSRMSRLARSVPHPAVARKRDNEPVVPVGVRGYCRCFEGAQVGCRPAGPPSVCGCRRGSAERPSRRGVRRRGSRIDRGAHARRTRVDRPSVGRGAARPRVWEAGSAIACQTSSVDAAIVSWSLILTSLICRRASFVVVVWAAGPRRARPHSAPIA
jgi:hypothetical protein